MAIIERTGGLQAPFEKSLPQSTYDSELRLAEFGESEFDYRHLNDLNEVLDQGVPLLKPTGIKASLGGPFGDEKLFTRDHFISSLALLAAMDETKFEEEKKFDAIKTDLPVDPSYQLFPTNEIPFLSQQNINLLTVNHYIDVMNTNAEIPGHYHELTDTLIEAVDIFLAQMATEDVPNRRIFKGALPHEFSTDRHKLPDFLPLDETGTRAFASVDGTGWCMLFLEKILQKRPELTEKYYPYMEAMILWAINNINKHDGKIGYTGYKDGENPKTKQALDGTWKDGKDSIVDANGEVPPHPIHYVQEQGMYWKVLTDFANRFKTIDPELSSIAREKANMIKKNFNEQFVFLDEKGIGIARAVDANGNMLPWGDIDALNVLGFIDETTGETILDGLNARHLPQIVRRLMDELYTPYGLRTQSPDSPMVPGHEYHSKTTIWPYANGRAVRTLEKLALLMDTSNPSIAKEFRRYAESIAKATAGFLLYFEKPFEVGHEVNGEWELYKEQKLNGEDFNSAEIQGWTWAEGEFIAQYLYNRGILQIPVKSKKVA